MIHDTLWLKERRLLRKTKRMNGGYAKKNRGSLSMMHLSSDNKKFFFKKKKYSNLLDILTLYTYKTPTLAQIKIITIINEIF